ncbi:MAG: YfhO family protein [Thermoguttaceae bacterium]|nr:YfhO family protein [Thermoguttaceae bacterium]
MNKLNAVVYTVLTSIVLLTAAYVFSSLIFYPGTIPGYRDASHFYYPLFLYLRSCFQAGDIPFWTQHLNLGFPLAANPTTALFYPPTWILALPIPAWLAFNLYIIGHVLLAVGTMFFLVRSWGRSVGAGIIAAISYGFGGIVLFQYSNLPYLVSAAWFPLGVYGIERALRTRRLKYICLSGIVLALMTLGGDVQTAYHLGMLALILVLMIFFKTRKKTEKQKSTAVIFSGSMRSLFLSVGILAGIAICGFILSAVQTLPTIELTFNSDRGQPNNSIAAAENQYAYSVPPWRVLEFAVPEVYGRQFPIYQRWIDALPGSDVAFWVPSLYMGTVPFFLACLSLTFYRGNNRRIWISWIIALALLASMGRLSIGYLIQTIGYWSGTDYNQNISSGWGGVYWLLTSIFPGYGMFRYPGKWLTVAAMGISVLSAYGWDRLCKDAQFRYRLNVCLGITAIAIIAWYFIAPTVLPWITDGLSNNQYGPYRGNWETEHGGISTFTLQFVSAFLLFAVCCLLKNQSNRQLNALIIIALVLLDLSVYSERLLTPIPASIFDSKTAEWSIPCRRICKQGVNWLPSSFQQTSSVDRESELAQWNRDSFYAYNGLYQHTTTMRYGGTFLLRNYVQFLLEGNARGVWAEKDFCEQFMSFDGQKISFKDNVDYNRVTKDLATPSTSNDQKAIPNSSEAPVIWRGANRFSVILSPTSGKRIPVVYYPGWTATLTGTGTDGKPVTFPACVYESEGLFLTVDAPDSNVWTAEFEFSPKSVYIGAVISLLGWVTLICAVILGKSRWTPDYFQKIRKNFRK